MNKQRRNRIAEALELISQARDILEEVKDEEQESYENLPESLQYGERGEQSLQVDVDKLKNRSDLLSQAIIKCQSVSDIDTLRGIEGESAQLYFSVFDEFILQQKDEFRFVTRSKRPPLDNVNALLSFSYSVATGMCTSALETVGLDPYVGFMHTDRPGRRSLALDLVEEFRAIMCDRFVISLINKRIINNGDFEKKEDGAVLLSEDGRKVFLTH